MSVLLKSLSSASVRHSIIPASSDAPSAWRHREKDKHENSSVLLRILALEIGTP